jgi:hypothetical protein
MFAHYTASGPEGNSFLKKSRQYSFLNLLNPNKKERILKLEQLNTYTSFSYSNRIPESLGIHWKEECTDFYDYSFEPVSINSITLKQFKSCLRSRLRNTIMDIVDISISDIRNRPKRTKSYVWDYSIDRPRKKIFLTDQYNYNESGLSKFRGVRTIVNVSPCNVRDAVTLSYESSITIRRFSRIIKQILHRYPESVYADSNVSKCMKYRQIAHRYGSFFMRDFKKCGLTFPRELR